MLVPFVTFAVAGATPRFAPVVEVRIVGDEFSPATIRVTPGDTVRWVNRDLIEHTVRHDSIPGLSSGDLAPGGEFRWVAGSPGRVRYYCTLHRGMRGEVVVRRR